MLIIPSINADNPIKGQTIIKVLRGFVSVAAIQIHSDTQNISNFVKLFDRQSTELELFIHGENHEARLDEIIKIHSDVNIGKVFFNEKNTDKVEQDLVNIRIFGINPGIIIDKENYKKPGIINKFEFATIFVKENSDYIEIYRFIKNNEFKGTLMLNFGDTRVPEEVLQDVSIDGFYIDITMNPMIKDTISSYRRAANSIYL